LLPHQTSGPADRFQNRTVAGAAAKVAIHVAHNLGVRRFGVLFKERLGRKDHYRRAKAALKCELIEERLLDGVKPLAVADPLDRRDPPSPGFISKVCASADGQTVNECGASTAHLDLARNLQSSQVAPVSKNFSQGFLRFEIELDRFSVQDERMLHRNNLLGAAMWSPFMRPTLYRPSKTDPAIAPQTGRRVHSLAAGSAPRPVLPACRSLPRESPSSGPFRQKKLYSTLHRVSRRGDFAHMNRCRSTRP